MSLGRMISHEKLKLRLPHLMARTTIRVLVLTKYMDHYFDWYDMNDEHKDKFAKMKLQGSTKIY